MPIIWVKSPTRRISKTMSKWGILMGDYGAKRAPPEDAQMRIIAPKLQGGRGGPSISKMAPFQG